MELLGQKKLIYTAYHLAGAGNCSSCFSFWWRIHLKFTTAATEEWTGAGAPVTETITTS
jgi:hypothetical protein